MIEKSNRKLPKVWRRCQLFPTTKFANFRYFFTVVEIHGMSPTAGRNFVKFPTTKESYWGLLTTGANCENKITGTVWTFLQLEKYKKNFLQWE